MAVAGRALFLKLPLTVVITAMFAHWIAGLPCIESLLIGAVLAPTDPVFAAALVGNDTVPARLRQLLNLESGVNDGLALPFVLIFLATASGSPDLQLGTLAGELVLGLAIGVGVPWVAIRLEATRFFSASAGYQPLNAFPSPSACWCRRWGRSPTAPCTSWRSPPVSPSPPAARNSGNRARKYSDSGPLGRDAACADPVPGGPPRVTGRWDQPDRVTVAEIPPRSERRGLLPAHWRSRPTGLPGSQPPTLSGTPTSRTLCRCRPRRRRTLTCGEGSTMGCAG